MIKRKGILQKVDYFGSFQYFDETIIPIRFVDFLFVTMRIFSWHAFPFPQSLLYDDFFHGFIERLQVEILSFLTGMAFSPP